MKINKKDLNIILFNKISNFLQESQVEEAVETSHFIERFQERLKYFTQIKPEDYQKSIEGIRKIVSINFSNIKLFNEYNIKSIAILIKQLNVPSNIGNNNTNIITAPNGKNFYRYVDEKGNDSTGNQIWLVIRDNRITTLMLRKSTQTQNDEENMIKMRVDMIIRDINMINSPQELIHQNRLDLVN